MCKLLGTSAKINLHNTPNGCSVLWSRKVRFRGCLLAEIIGSEWQSCNLNPGLSTLEPELELIRALLYSHEDRDCLSLRRGCKLATWGPNLAHRCVLFGPCGVFWKSGNFTSSSTFLALLENLGDPVTLSQRGDTRLLLRSGCALLSLSLPDVVSTNYPVLFFSPRVLALGVGQFLVTRTVYIA